MKKIIQDAIDVIESEFFNFLFAAIAITFIVGVFIATYNPDQKTYNYYLTKDGQEQQVDECRAFEGKVYCAKDGTLFTDIESIRVEEK